MANKMLIDATHPEETRVVVLRGNRVEEFDFETAHRKQLRGNIYLAKVTRVEPSLQAAFVEYGGNRHGFLAFSEIHPDYYQIPVADRQALLDEDARAHRDGDEEDEEPRRSSGGGNRRRGRGRHRNREARRHDRNDETVLGEATLAEPGSEATDRPEGEFHSVTASDAPASDAPASDAPADAAWAPPPADFAPPDREPAAENAPTVASTHAGPIAAPVVGETANPPVPAEIGAENPMASSEVQAGAAEAHPAETATDAELHPQDRFDAPHSAPAFDAPASESHYDDEDDEEDEEEEETVDTVGGADAMEEVMERAPRAPRRQYKIQEVIKRRQIMLVQVVKEERGTKGAALTTYLSLAGRYSVLMPNTARGGGISRKITSGEDRKRLREIAEELDVPEGMGVILRTAGANRTKAEVKRDFEYLMRLWETIRDLTLKSTAPALVYEEGSLAKRSIRDLYSKDIEEIVVAGDEGYRDAKDFMRMLMPSHARNVKLYKDSLPIFARYGIESQLDAMFSPTVQLRSGGYIVINQTEALVAIDVNSGRSTREHHIEDTALKTNCEAAEEVARQLRLRDLAGLIVIDFIDMDEKRNNRTVERKLKDALRNDRARIQVGRISHFGLMEMSRQRIRTSVLESSTEKCPHCGGTGHVRSVSSVALQLLRSLDETLQKGATHNLIVRTRPDTALYVLNHKRAHLRALEERYKITITVEADESIGGTVTYTIDRGEQVMTLEQAKALAAQFAEATPLIEEEEPEIEDIPEADEAEELIRDSARDDDDAETDEDGPSQGERAAGDGEREGGRRRRRRRRGRGSDRNGDTAHDSNADEQPSAAHETVPEHEVAHLDPYYSGTPASAEGPAPADTDDDEAGESNGNGEPRRRRRGRRGGRRNRRNRDDADFHPGGNGADPHDEAPRADNADEDPAHDAGHRPHAYEQAEQPYPSAPPPARDEVAMTVASEAARTLPIAQRPSDEPKPDAAPRRRSTVREPAPVFASKPAETAMAPVPPQPAPEPITPTAPGGAEAEDSRPRRTGWWSRRLLGGGDKS